MNNKYETLVNILDKIIEKKPAEKYQKLYSLDTQQSKDQSRSRAYIHLYLMARYGILDFKDREVLLTDGANDGGIDAFYVDKDQKIINIIQSKFRTNQDNFEKKPIEPDELLSMDIKRIIQGETCDESGVAYSGKIKGFQRKLDEIKNIGKYEYKVTILANVTHNKTKLDRLTGGFDCDVYDYNATYSKLVFPVVCGNYFNQEELEVNINLKNAQHPRIQYTANLGAQDASITVLFAPTSEIARTLHKYKNSILKFNPRSYLDMRKNSVNSEILNTLINTNDNEFALFNNGITIVCGDCNFTESTGKKNKASLSLHSPQIINGGQTAFTLSNVYEKHLNDPEKLDSIFEGKEVLVKIISFVTEEDEDTDDDECQFTGFSDSNLAVIEKVSQATNRQNPIDDADRKANEQTQIDFQEFAYEYYGLYYERKRGEFGDGISSKYIDRSYLIKRDDLIRCCLASDLRPGEARRANKKYLFSDPIADKYMAQKASYDNYLLGYILFNKLKALEKELRTPENKYAENIYGSALRYGKFAVVAAVFAATPKITISELFEKLYEVLQKWKEFESHVVKDIENKNTFFSNDLNMLNYYKSGMVNKQIIDFFSKK